MSINRVNISGNLTRDPELRATASGMQVLSFGVAVNDRRKNPQSGDWEDYPNFIDCTMFGNRAESVSKYIQKGSKVAIEGKLRWSQWEKEGQKRSKIEVVVDEIEIMQKSQNQQPQNTGQYQAQQYTQPQQYQQPQGQYYQQPSQPYTQAQVPMYTGEVIQPATIYDAEIPF